MHAQVEFLGVRLGKINCLSFFMFSRLRDMEESYTQAPIDGILGSARQVFVFLARQVILIAALLPSSPESDTCSRLSPPRSLRIRDYQIRKPNVQVLHESA